MAGSGPQYHFIFASVYQREIDRGNEWTESCAIVISDTVRDNLAAWGLSYFHDLSI